MEEDIRRSRNLIVGHVHSNTTAKIPPNKEVQTQPAPEVDPLPSQNSDVSVPQRQGPGDSQKSNIETNTQESAMNSVVAVVGNRDTQETVTTNPMSQNSVDSEVSRSTNDLPEELSEDGGVDEANIEENLNDPSTYDPVLAGTLLKKDETDNKVKEIRNERRKEREL